MGFDNKYPNRKDWRKPYYKLAKRVDGSCRNGGSCPWCKGNRTYRHRKRLASLESQLIEINETESTSTEQQNPLP